MKNLIVPAVIFLASTSACSVGGHDESAREAPMTEPPGPAPMIDMPEEKRVTSTPIAPVTKDAIYVISGGENAVTVLDVTSGETLGVIKLDGATFPHHI